MDEYYRSLSVLRPRSGTNQSQAVVFGRFLGRQTLVCAFATNLFAVACLAETGAMLVYNMETGVERSYNYGQNRPIGFVNDWLFIFEEETNLGFTIYITDLRTEERRLLLRNLYRTRTRAIGIQLVPGFGTLVVAERRIHKITVDPVDQDWTVKKMKGNPKPLRWPLTYLRNEQGLALQTQSGRWREYDLRENRLVLKESSLSLFNWVEQWASRRGQHSPFFGYMWLDTALARRAPDTLDVDSVMNVSYPFQLSGFDYAERYAFTAYADDQGVLFRFWTLTGVRDEMQGDQTGVSDYEIEPNDMGGGSDDD